MKGHIRIGISGWRYEPWRQVFYPKGLVQKRELEFASRALPTIELNGSFYALQRPSSYLNWYEQTPPDFVFSIKRRATSPIFCVWKILKPPWRISLRPACWG